MKSFLVRSGKPLISKNYDGIEPIVGIKEKKGGNGFILDYTFPGFWFYYEDKNEFNIDDQRICFTQIKIPKAGFINEIDKPLLPSFGRYLRIPESYTFGPVTNIETNRTNLDVLKKETEGAIRIKRSEYELSDEWNRACYDKDYEEDYFYDFFIETESYPKDEDIVKVTGPYIIDGCNSIIIHVRPFQYKNPKLADIVFYDSIKFDIVLKPDDKADSRQENPDCHEVASKNLFLNPGAETRMRFVPPKPEIDETELLIIYNNSSFLKPIQKLRQWKEKKGLKTEIVSIEDINDQEKTDDTIRNIKKYIRFRRGAYLSKLRYVILFGDVDDIPPEDGVNSDYYYSAPRDPDGLEPVLPWLACGRIPVKEIKDKKNGYSEADSVVDQIINYEKNPPQNESYYKEMTFCAYLEDSAYYWQKRRGKTDNKDSSNYVKTMEDIRDHLVNNHGITIDRIYEEEEGAEIEKFCNGSDIPTHVKKQIVDGPTAKKKVIEAVLGGQLIIGHRGHGSASKWRFPEFNPKGLLKKIPRKGKDPQINVKPSIFFSVNCLTGRYNRKSDCLGELLLKSDGAAPSLIAPSRSSNTWLNNSMMKALFDSLWPGILKSFHDQGGRALKHSRLGDILNYGKTYLLIAQSNSGAKTKRHFEIYHVLGDPSLELWKDIPKPVNIRAHIKENNLVVELLGNDCPEESVVTICSENPTDFKVHKRMRLEGNRMELPLHAIFPDSFPENGFSVCFHAPGYLFSDSFVEFAKPDLTVV